MNTKVSGIISAIIGGIIGWVSIIAIPFLLLVGFNLIDYFTAIFAAKNRGEKISSKKGLNGIIKKLSLWFAIICGGGVDWVLFFMSESLGMNIGIKYLVSTILCIWLIINEIISVLENIKDCGAPLPAFLLKLTKNIKSQIEEKGVIQNDTTGT